MFFKCICNRHGICSDIYSDNAINFVGVNCKLQELKQLFLSDILDPKIQKLTAELGIRWHFILPQSPILAIRGKRPLKIGKNSLK